MKYEIFTQVVATKRYEVEANSEEEAEEKFWNEEVRVNGMNLCLEIFLIEGKLKNHCFYTLFSIECFFRGFYGTVQKRIY